jgi:hypothetical protein
MLDSITKNPMPAALVGLGMFWLLKNPSEEKSGYYRGRVSTSYHSPEYAETSGDASMEEQVKEGFQSVKETIQDSLSEWKDQAGYQAQHWKEQAGHKAFLWKEGTEQKMEEVKGYIREHSKAARNEVHSLLDHSPLAMGAVMVAVGAVVAAVLPESRKENQWMGGSRDKMMKVVKTKVQSAVEDVAYKTGQVAQRAFQKDGVDHV